MQPSDAAAPIHGVDLSSSKYAGAELAILRAHLERLAHEMRMKTRGADAELRDRSRMLAREVTWFSEQASKPETKSHDYLIRLGASLHRQLGELRNQVAISIN